MYSRISEAARRAWLDVTLSGLAVFWGVGSLSFPFGHDQGVHYYVAREWLLRGAVPYRDAFDYKTPGIFLVHAAAIAVGGEGEMPIRVAELACVLAVGWTVARLAVGRRAAPPGSTGFAMLATSVLYFGYFSFWDTAQCEIWAAALAFGALVAATFTRGWHRACVAAGLLSGGSLLMKPTCVLLVAVAAALLVRRDDRRLSGCASFLGGILAPLAVVLAYFAHRGALADLVDVLVGADRQYVVGTRRVHSLRELWQQCVEGVAWLNPFSSLALAFPWLGRSGARRGPLGGGVRDHALGLWTFAAAFVGVVVQLKFYRYHLAVLVPPLALVVTRWAVLAARANRQRARIVASALALVAAYVLTSPRSCAWVDTTKQAFELWTGALSRSEFASRFNFPELYYSESDIDGVAEWLRAQSSESDIVAVRGFEPEIYALSGRHTVGRFFWTIPLTDPLRTYRRAEWLEEDRRALAQASPRFVVALRSVHSGPEAPETFVAAGYVERVTIGRLTILERPRT